MPDTHANFGKGTFAEKSPAIMARLMKDFNLTKEEAGAIMGNLGHESRGFKDMQEIHPRFGRGGLGWAQWTGPRRRAFEAWSKAHGLDPKSDEANYGFLHHELTTNYAKAIPALKNARGNKVVAFEQAYEAAGVKKYESRERYAHIALDAYNRANQTAWRLPSLVGSAHAAEVHNSAWKAAVANHRHTHRTSSNSTHIGELHVHSAAKDATGIAKDIKPALSRKLLTTQSDYGPI